jgi:lactate dehydrogenase-like 2-hydroxyacid dehydrogenase
LLLTVARKVVSADLLVKSGGFTGYNPNHFLGRKITGETLGLVGAGKIGGTMARRSMGFDMRILYTDPRPNQSLEREFKATRVDLKTLLQESDFVSLHVPYTSSNHHLIGKEELQLMKKDAILINTSRGKVIDESALVHALKAGSLGGAGLDVYEDEPLLARGLDRLENVVLTPHIGSATYDARSKMAVQAAENLMACLSGHIPSTCLNP